MRSVGIGMVIVILAAALAGCGAGPPAKGAPHLTDLNDIGRLRSMFNSRSGEPRLVVLVSPT
jgi:hypothetical protein